MMRGFGTLVFWPLSAFGTARCGRSNKGLPLVAQRQNRGPAPGLSGYGQPLGQLALGEDGFNRHRRCVCPCAHAPCRWGMADLGRLLVLVAVSLGVRAGSDNL